MMLSRYRWNEDFSVAHRLAGDSHDISTWDWLPLRWVPSRPLFSLIGRDRGNAKHMRLVGRRAIDSERYRARASKRAGAL